MAKGSSIGSPPSQVRRVKLEINNQNRICDRGRNVWDCCVEVWRDGIIKRIRIEASSASTPPNLFGMDRRMA